MGIMISREDRLCIVELAEKYSASRVLLFGSAVVESDPRDIDLAVEGIASDFFFKFYSDLMWSLSRPVDLVDLARKSRFSNLIEQEGIPLYVTH